MPRLSDVLASPGFGTEGLSMSPGRGSEGVHRVTLSKLVNNKDVDVPLSTVDKLCAYFGCAIGDLVKHDPTGSEQSSWEPDGQAGQVCGFRMVSNRAFALRKLAFVAGKLPVNPRPDPGCPPEIQQNKDPQRSLLHRVESLRILAV